MVDNQHQKIRGYRDLTEEEIGMINAVKESEVAAGELWRSVMNTEGIDQRWAAVARTHFEEGYSALVRSIAQPESSF